MKRFFPHLWIWLIMSAVPLYGIAPDHLIFAQEKPVKASQATFSESEYLIGRGDRLTIITWKEPDFTLEVLVRTDGKISFPLLNDIYAAGLQPSELKKMLEDSLRKYVTDPLVTIIVKDPESQKFYILGEVAKTGEYQLQKNLTVLQAFAIAGGFTQWASEKRIIVLRRVEGQEKIFQVNYKDIVKGKDLDQNIYIQANDTIIVP